MILDQLKRCGINHMNELLNLKSIFISRVCSESYIKQKSSRLVYFEANQVMLTSIYYVLFTVSDTSESVCVEFWVLFTEVYKGTYK